MSARNRELGYLIAVAALTGLGFASVYIARQAVIGWGSLTYAAFFIGLYLIAHVVTRLTVPHADPYLLPMTGFLTAIGLTEIYRLGPSDAFKQGLWVVIGVAVFAGALIGLRRDYRVLEYYKYLFGIGAIALLFLPRATRDRRDGQRRAALDARRRAPVPAGRAGQDLPDHLPRRLPAREARGARAGAAEGRRARPRDLGRGDARARLDERPRVGPPLLRDLHRDALHRDRRGSRSCSPGSGSSSPAATSPTARSRTSPSGSRSGCSRGRPRRSSARSRARWRSARTARATSSSSRSTRSRTAASAAPGSARGRSRPRRARQLIPDVNTDFIYSALAQELGLVGVSALLLVFMVFVARGMKIALAGRRRLLEAARRRAHLRLRASRRS